MTCALEEFYNEVNSMYGFTVEMSYCIDEANRNFNNSIGRNGTTTESTLTIGAHDPAASNSGYKVKIGDFEKKTKKSGALILKANNFSIVSIVSAWEDNFRLKIAKDCGKTGQCDREIKNQILSDVFHDIQKYRDGIIHSKGKLKDGIKTLDFIQKGNQIEFDEDKICVLFDKIIEELSRIGREYYCREFNFRFDINARW